MTKTSTFKAPFHQPFQNTPTRFIGVDIARFVAIAGMIAAHVIVIQMHLPGVEDQHRATAEIVDQLTAGNASALFAVLGGLSIVFASQRLLSQERTRAAIGAVAVRGCVLILFGLILGFIDYGIAIVLAYYGIAMLIVAPFVRAQTWVLWSAAAVLTLGFWWIKVALEFGRETPYGQHQITWPLLFEDTLSTLRDLFFTGAYSAITWAVYLFVGMIIARFLLAAKTRKAIMIATTILIVLGGALTGLAQIVSYLALTTADGMVVFQESFTREDFHWLLFEAGGNMTQFAGHPMLELIAAPHSGSLSDILSTIGLAVLCVGAFVLIFDHNRIATGAERNTRSLKTHIIDVFRATGAASLTVYTLHVMFTSWVSIPYLHEHAEPLTSYASMPWWVAGSAAFWLQISLAVMLGAVLSKLQKRGPLEALVTGVVAFVVEPKSTSVPVEQTR